MPMNEMFTQDLMVYKKVKLLFAVQLNFLFH